MQVRRFGELKVAEQEQVNVVLKVVILQGVDRMVVTQVTEVPVPMVFRVPVWLRLLQHRPAVHFIPR